MRRLSLTLRLTLSFGALFAVVLIGLGAFIRTAVERHFEEGDLAELHGKLELARAMLAQVDGPDALAEVAQRLDAALVGHHGLSITVVQPDGGIVFASSGAAFPSAQIGAAVASASDPHPPGRVWEQGGRHYRGILAGATLGTAGSAPARIVVSMDIEHHLAFMAGFERSLWLAIALAIAASGAFGWLVARSGLAPLRHMADVARGISANRLHERIDVGALPVELHGLAAEFNSMMVRLAEDFARLHEFSSDIAHELRTPVSNLMTQTQVALSRTRSADAYRDILHSNLEEFERLARMIADMLFLAQADNGRLPRPAETVELAVEARALAEFYEALADECGVRIEVSGAATVIGDRLMLRRALSNLLSNALRHARAGTTVAIAIEGGRDEVRLSVTNAGDTIPPEHLGRLFERFHRVDPSRTRQGDGAGLGLAITRSIVAAHGGRVEVESAAGLTRFRLSLPPAASEAGQGTDPRAQRPITIQPETEESR